MTPSGIGTVTWLFACRRSLRPLRRWSPHRRQLVLRNNPELHEQAERVAGGPGFCDPAALDTVDVHRFPCGRAARRRGAEVLPIVSQLGGPGQGDQISLAEDCLDGDIGCIKGVLSTLDAGLELLRSIPLAGPKGAMVDVVGGQQLVVGIDVVRETKSRRAGVCSASFSSGVVGGQSATGLASGVASCAAATLVAPATARPPIPTPVRKAVRRERRLPRIWGQAIEAVGVHRNFFLDRWHRMMRGRFPKIQTERTGANWEYTPVAATRWPHCRVRASKQRHGRVRCQAA